MDQRYMHLMDTIERLINFHSPDNFKDAMPQAIVWHTIPT